MSNILWFRSISKNDTATVGGKGANLGEIFRAGFPVPNGFCVTAQAYFDFLKKTGLDKKIAQLLSGVSADNTKQLNQASGQVKRAILRSNLPENLKKEIIENYLVKKIVMLPCARPPQPRICLTHLLPVSNQRIWICWAQMQ